MISIVVATIILILTLVVVATYKAVRYTLQKPILSFDKSTELLLKQQKIKRSNDSKVDKLVALSSLEIEIDSHLNDVEVEMAKVLSEPVTLLS